MTELLAAIVLCSFLLLSTLIVISDMLRLVAAKGKSPAFVLLDFNICMPMFLYGEVTR